MSTASGWIILHLKLYFYSLPAILLEDRNSSESAWKNKISISALNTPEPAMMHEPLVGSQKRKARKTKITHLVRTADGRVSPAAGTLGKETGVKILLKLHGWRRFEVQATYQGSVFKLACFHTCIEWSLFKVQVSSYWEITESIIANFFCLNDQICLFSLDISLLRTVNWYREKWKMVKGNLSQFVSSPAKKLYCL